MSDGDEVRSARRFAEHYRASPPPSRAARERLDRAVGSLPPPRRRRRRASGLETPLLRAAVLVIVVGATLAIGIELGRRPSPPGKHVASTLARAEVVDQPRIVRFVLVARGASQVNVVGDFNGWDPDATPLQRHGGADLWSAEVVLPPGRHLYAFVADGGRWISDPQAPLAPENEFGFRNSVLLVGESDPS
jgi:hypothetical protein